MNYELANLIINAFIALGTVGSVVFSLWAAVFSRREKAKVHVSSVILIQDQAQEQAINITILNTGKADFRLSWMSINLNNQTIQALPRNFKQPLPDEHTIFTPGYRASSILNRSSLLSMINQVKINDNQQISEILKKGSITIYTTLGSRFRAKFSDEFIKYFCKE
ncbi:MAG: hypothetical protein WC194_11780 [Mesotoga sp.]|uniref:hypothetical protein n=1 Tax=Mesotoga sp. TaxID=2053577 RepID=UPI003561DCD9